MTPRTEAEVQPRSNTDFQKKTWEYQKDSPKTPSSAAGNAGCVIGLGVFAWAVYFGMRLFGFSLEEFFKTSGSLMGLVGILLMLLATAAPVIGVILLLIALLRPKRSIKCPFCSAEHRLYKAVRSYVCTGCASVLRFVPHQATNELVKVQCPMCRTEWAAAADANEMNCFGCGAPLTVKAGEMTVATKRAECWACRESILEGVFACHRCGCLVRQPVEFEPYRIGADLHELIAKSLPPIDADGMDVISLRANSASGFLIRALWKAQVVLNSTLRPNASAEVSLEELALHLKALEEAIDLLTEALTSNPDLAGVIDASLPTFNASLRQVLSLIADKSQAQPSGIPPAHQEVVKTLASKQRALVSRLTRLLKRSANQSNEQKWLEPLIKEKDGIITADEADRVRGWVAKFPTPAQLGKVRVPEPASIFHPV